LLIRRRVPVVPVVSSSSVVAFEELAMLPVLLVPLVARLVPLPEVLPEVLEPDVPVEPDMVEPELLL
jgi:hypothetical protein